MSAGENDHLGTDNLYRVYSVVLLFCCWSSTSSLNLKEKWMDSLVEDCCWCFSPMPLLLRLNKEMAWCCRYHLIFLFDVRCVMRPFVVAGKTSLGGLASHGHLISSEGPKREGGTPMVALTKRRGRFEVGRDLWATAAIADSLRDAWTRRSRGLATGPRTRAAKRGDAHRQTSPFFIFPPLPPPFSSLILFFFIVFLFLLLLRYRRTPTGAFLVLQSWWRTLVALLWVSGSQVSTRSSIRHNKAQIKSNNKRKGSDHLSYFLCLVSSSYYPPLPITLFTIHWRSLCITFFSLMTVCCPRPLC